MATPEETARLQSEIVGFFSELFFAFNFYRRLFKTTRLCFVSFPAFNSLSICILNIHNFGLQSYYG